MRTYVEKIDEPRMAVGSYDIIGKNTQSEDFCLQSITRLKKSFQKPTNSK